MQLGRQVWLHGCAALLHCSHVHVGAAPHYHGTSGLWKKKLKIILSNALYIENLLKIFRLSLIAKILTESILTGKQLLPLKAEFEIVFVFCGYILLSSLTVSCINSANQSCLQSDHHGFHVQSASQACQINSLPFFPSPLLPLTPSLPLPSPALQAAAVPISWSLWTNICKSMLSKCMHSTM